MSARYWLLMSDVLIGMKDEIRWPDGVRPLFVPETHRHGPNNFLLNQSRWVLVEDDYAPPELEGQHVENIVIAVKDGQPWIADRRLAKPPFWCADPFTADQDTATQQIGLCDDITCDCTPATPPPWRVRDLLAPVLDWLRRGQRGGHDHTRAERPASRPDHADGA